MAKEVNVLFIHGAGPNIMFGGALEQLRNITIRHFGRRIYAPPAVDHQEAGLIARYLDKWKDDQILIGLSCGCSAINKIAASRPSERIPFAMYCSPSRWCNLGYVPPNVRHAMQVTSNAWDGWNLGGAQIVQRRDPTQGSLVEVFKSGYGHTTSPLHPHAWARLREEIERALA